MEILAILGIIASVAVLYLIFYWLPKKESQLIGYYKEAKLFGRVYAYFAVGFLFGGIFMPISQIVIAIVDKDAELSNTVLSIAVGLIGIAIGFYMYYRVAKKVPNYMKKQTMIDLTLCGFGIACRVSLFIMMFFFKTWWEFSKPEEYTLEKTGQTVMVFPDGNVYDSSTSRFGKLTDDGKAVIWD